ncbi:MAG: hypothetical protein LBV12_05050 [Puniceicoccales bacterium]|jgi:hypothetical protein|nr:hypothetical protein [Puniceicoccales bacterium]
MRSLSLLCAGAVGLCSLHAGENPDQVLEKQTTVFDSGAWAKLLQNPLSPITRVDLETSFDFGIDPYNGNRITPNIKFNIPARLSEDWWLLTPASNPIVFQHGVFDDEHSSESGLGDMFQSFWLSPNHSSGEGLFWGAGAIFLFPFATERQIGLRTWAAGPEAAIAWQNGPWTYSLTAHHMWSYAGSGDHISETFFIPHCAYTFDEGFTVSAMIPADYDWKNHRWLLPVILDFSQTFDAFGQPFCVGIYGSYYIKTYDKMPEWGVGFRIVWAMP